MNERLKQLRKALDLTQKQFAERIGSVQNTITGYETGRRVPSNQVITLICREFDVNEEWLVTGNGEMFRKRTRSQEISDFVVDILKGEEDNFKRRFVAMLSRLDEDDWALLAKIAQELAKE